MPPLASVLRPCTWGHSDRGLMIHKDSPDSMQLSLPLYYFDGVLHAVCGKGTGHSPCASPHACMPACPHGVRVDQLQCDPVLLLGYAVDSQIPLQCMRWVMVCYRGSLPMYNEGFAVTGHFIVGQCLISTENNWGHLMRLTMI